MIPPALFFFFKIVLAIWCIFDYMRNLSYISVLGVDGLLLSACPVYFMDIVNFIGDCVSLVIILAFAEALLCFGYYACLYTLSL